MIRREVLIGLLSLSVLCSNIHAQSRSLNLQEQDKQKLQEIISQVKAFQAQRGAGGRGTPGTAPVLPLRLYGTNPFGAWWTNTELINRLGITEEQKAKIERAFENHRQKLQSGTELLNKEEKQLATLIEAESVDRNAVLAQIDRVTQARSEMERENSAMMLEMREALTRAQWMQLPLPNWSISGGLYAVRTGAGAGGRGTAPAGQRQQQ